MNQGARLTLGLILVIILAILASPSVTVRAQGPIENAQATLFAATLAVQQTSQARDAASADLQLTRTALDNQQRAFDQGQTKTAIAATATAQANTSATARAHANETARAHTNETAQAHTNETAQAHTNETAQAHTNETEQAHANETARAHTNETAAAHATETRVAVAIQQRQDAERNALWISRGIAIGAVLLGLGLAFVLVRIALRMRTKRTVVQVVTELPRDETITVASPTDSEVVADPLARIENVPDDPFVRTLDEMFDKAEHHVAESVPENL